MENKDAYSQVVLKAWEDSGFKKKLINNPVETLREEGMEIPENFEITVCEETENQHFLFLPTGELSNEEIEAISAGVSPQWLRPPNWLKEKLIESGTRKHLLPPLE